jgi:glycosyltransferase involved in cell wall biosynthesis
MGLQEPAWWATPQHHTWWDRLYMRTMLPLYCRRSSHFFPWTQFVLDENRKYLRAPLEHATVTYTGIDASFHRPYDAATLDAFRRRHDLPQRFILSVSRVENLGNRSATFSGTKNIETTLRAFARMRPEIPHALVVVGRRVREYLEHVGWTVDGFERVRFMGFVPHEDIAKLYRLAELFVMPSYYEGCGIAMIEAMASGCPVVASRTGACPEVGAEAAIAADPHDASDFAAKMLKVLRDPHLASELREKSLRRARLFNWERVAHLTLDGLTQAAAKRPTTPRAAFGPSG